MNKHTHQFLSFIYCISLSTIICANNQLNVPWAIIGAGPAGISVAGILIDSGVLPTQIAWIDPEFKVGRLGKYYGNVPGNAKVKQYIDFLKACKTFSEIRSESISLLYSMPPEQAPQLKFIIQPLQDITEHLKTKTIPIVDELVSLDFHDNQWYVGTKKQLIRADHVILATGSHPRQVHYEGVQQIPLDMALDKTALATYVKPEDTVGVIGSAHSALLIVKYLTEMPVKQIINFFNKSITYPTPVNGGIAWPESGLKGELAAWCQTVLAQHPPANLKRIFNTPELFKQWFPTCTKIIFAGGYDRNELPAINGDQTLYDNYDTSSGIIGPRLFGIGIAFPEKKIDALGNAQYMVGLPFFMPYIQKIVPEWMKKNLNLELYNFNDLFYISVL